MQAAHASNVQARYKHMISLRTSFLQAAAFAFRDPLTYLQGVIVAHGCSIPQVSPPDNWPTESDMVGKWPSWLWPVQNFVFCSLRLLCITKLYWSEKIWMTRAGQALPNDLTFCAFQLFFIWYVQQRFGLKDERVSGTSAQDKSLRICPKQMYQKHARLWGHLVLQNCQENKNETHPKSYGSIALVQHFPNLFFPIHSICLKK